MVLIGKQDADDVGAVRAGAVTEAGLDQVSAKVAMIGADDSLACVVSKDA